MADPDCPRPEELMGYELQRGQVVANTQAMLEGHLVNNVLLFGDGGTGKSATVKVYAVPPRIRGSAADRGAEGGAGPDAPADPLPGGTRQKFILFIDDLTFSEDDPNFGTLKATLEGSIAARMRNTVIYATSNRRHLVKETFDDGSDKHSNDTVQERISLSERFGITITYSRPQKNLYLEIVHALAEQNGLDITTEELDAQAEQFALQKSGRSARAAKQLIDQLLTQYS